MSVGNRRSELEIIRDILSMGKGRTTILRYSVNLSHSQMQKYLGFLEQSNLINLERQGTRTITFEVTDKGQEVLKKMEQLFALVGIDSWNKWDE